jgi:hypothetical protein
MIIQIIGLPGAGKTALAKELAARVNGIHLNADEIRADLSKDLGFSEEDRVEQARRIGAVARILDNQGHIVIADFICPTEATRTAFGKPDSLVWVDRIKESRFPNTDAIWEQPNYTLRLPDGLTIEQEVEAVIASNSLHDWRKPTTLLLGRYQPWHEGHQALLEKAYERTDQVLIAVRDTQGTSEKDPLSYQQVVGHIVSSVPRAFIVKVPNITNIVYGRDVGYKIEQVELGAEIHAISATQKRKEMGL